MKNRVENSFGENVQGNFQKGRSYHLRPLVLTFQNCRKTQACKCLVCLLSAKVYVYYRKVGSSNTSHLEAHTGFYRLLKKGIFNPYVL